VNYLLGEFYLVSKNHRNSEDTFPGILRIVLQLNSNSEYTNNSVSEVHMRISNHVQKYTQSFYIQFHHLTSYYLQYKHQIKENPKAFFTEEEFSYPPLIRLLGDISSQYNNNFRADRHIIKWNVSPNLVIFYLSNIRPILQSGDVSTFLNSMGQVLQKLDYDGTKFLLLSTYSLEEISFTSTIGSGIVCYELKHIVNTKSNNKGMKAINIFLFHPNLQTFKPFPYLERISLKGALLKFPNMSYSSSQKCNNRYEPSLNPYPVCGF